MKKQLKRDCKLALKTWGRIVAATLMCIIVYVSLYVITTAFFSEQIGYRITGKDEAGNAVQIAEHYYTAEEGPQTEPELEDGQKSTPIKQLTAGAQRGLGDHQLGRDAVYSGQLPIRPAVEGRQP